MKKNDTPDASSFRSTLMLWGARLMKNDFLNDRLIKSIETYGRIAKVDSISSPADLIRTIVAISDIVRSGSDIIRFETEKHGGLETTLPLGINETNALVRKLAPSAHALLKGVREHFQREVQDLSKNLMADNPVVDTERVAAFEDDDLVSLFVNVDEMELVAGFLLDCVGDETVLAVVSPIVELGQNAPWVFLSVADFIENWNKGFESDDAFHPLWIRLSRAKFEAVLRHSEYALEGLDAFDPIPEPVLLASMMNTIATQQPALLAALVDVTPLETHEFRFSSPDGLLQAEMIVPVSSPRSDVALDVIITSKVGRDSQDIELVRGLIGKRIRFGGAEGKLSEAAANGAQATLQASAVKRLPFSEACIYVDNVRWDLTQ